MNIYVVGDVMLDVEMQVQPRENYEGAAICLTGTRQIYYPGGAANVAALLQGLGHNVSLFGLVGSDWAGKELYNVLNKIEKHCLALLLTTTVKTRIHDDGMLIRVDCENPKACDWAVERCLREIESTCPDCVVFSDYGKGVFDRHVKVAVQRIIQREPAIPTVVDPKLCNYADIWDGCTVATPTAEEVDQLVLNVRSIATTHGAEGAVVTDDFGITAIPCREVENPQTVGAGDAFTAGIASALSQGDNIMKAAQFAVEFATDYVSQPRGEVYSKRWGRE